MSSRINFWLWIGLLVGGARIALAFVMVSKADVIPSPMTWLSGPSDTDDSTPDRTKEPRTSPPVRLRGLTH